MKFKCVGCGAKYFHNHYILPPPKVCRFCGKEMVKDGDGKLTPEEFGEFYLNR